MIETESLARGGAFVAYCRGKGIPGVKEIVIGADQAGRRLDRVARALIPGMNAGLIQKNLRTGKIRLNGEKAEGGARTEKGDRITLEVDEAFFTAEEKPDRFLMNFRHRLRVVYEDENILLADKQPGLLCHSDGREKVDTLVNHIRAYLYQKGESPEADLCNRIDRFTGGIVIAAKNRDALRDMDLRIREGHVRKFYLCAVRGRMEREEGVLEDWLYQAPGEKSVRVSARQTPGAKRAVTAYRTLERGRGVSLVECELYTGRTHQIRAQFANAGHPLLGDGQYGRPGSGGRDYQALYAWRVRFEESGGMLNYLAGRSFQVRDVPFAREILTGKRTYEEGNE